VGQFISLFKDTSLVITVGMLDLLGIAKSIFNANPEWTGSQSEVYLFIGFVYWIFTYSMSQASQRIETRLGVGRR
jgi:general L-amino acid transport system permease protein